MSCLYSIQCSYSEYICTPTALFEQRQTMNTVKEYIDLVNQSLCYQHTGYLKRFLTKTSVKHMFLKVRKYAIKYLQCWIIYCSQIVKCLELSIIDNVWNSLRFRLHHFTANCHSGDSLQIYIFFWYWYCRYFRI